MRIINLSKTFLSSVLYMIFYIFNIFIFLLLVGNNCPYFAVFSYIVLFVLTSIIHYFMSKKYMNIVINKFVTIIIYTLFICGLFAILFTCVPDCFTFFLFVYYVFFEMFHNEFIVNLIFIQFILPILAFILGLSGKQNKQSEDGSSPLTKA